MEDSRKGMVPLSENDLEEVSGGTCDGMSVSVAPGYHITLAEKDENSKAMTADFERILTGRRD